MRMKYVGHTREDISERVTRVIRDLLALDEKDIDFDLSITEHLVTESLDQVRLFMTLEDEFGGTISDEDLEKIGTLSDLVEYLEHRDDTT